MFVLIVGLWSAALLIAAVVGQVVLLERREVNRAVRSLGNYEFGRVGVRRRELSRSFFERALVPSMHRIGTLVRTLAPAGMVDRIRRDLVLAGSPADWDAERVLAAKFVLAGAGVAFGSLLAAAAGAGASRVFLGTAVFGAAGFFGPDRLIRSRGSQRQEAIRKALPDALDLLAISAQAGLGFDTAMSRLVAESSGPLADEFNRTLREMQLGAARADALRALGDRTNVNELKSFVLAMVQADSFGMSIANVLRVEANELRTKRRQVAEEKAQKVPVKMVFPLVLCIFPTLFVVLLGPAAINIYNALIK
jgi:tight adherence protein C